MVLNKSEHKKVDCKLINAWLDIWYVFEYIYLQS